MVVALLRHAPPFAVGAARLALLVPAVVLGWHASASALAAAGHGEAVAPATAWVSVPVATVWARPGRSSQLDGVALAEPTTVRSWLAGLTALQWRDLEARTMTQALFDEPVVVLARSGAWAKVRIPSQRGSVFRTGIVGWVPMRQLSTTAAPSRGRSVIVAARSTWLYELRNGLPGQKRLLLSYDTVLPLLGSSGDFVLVGLPGGGEGAIASSDVRSPSHGPIPGTTIAAQAARFRGLLYLWGGTSAFGYDCSGLVYALYAQYDRILPRDAADQLRAGRPVSLSALRPGDLLFFAAPGGTGFVHHVAVYAGHGVMIDAPHTGATIEAVPMRHSRIWKEFAGAARIT